MKIALSTCFAFIIVLYACKNKPAHELIPIYIEPYYNSDPFKINIGSYSEELKTTDEKKLLELAQTIKSKIDEVNIMTLFVLSTRLYDLNQKDEAVYWFYTAAFRRNVLKQTAENAAHGTDAGELIQALDAYKTLLGKYVNGYALGQVDKNIEICKAVIATNSNMKSLSFAYPQLKFDETKFPDAVKNAVQDRKGFIKYMSDNKEEIKKQRTQNGIDGKY